MPEVSVIMGIYNENRKQAAQAVDSILKQTFTDFEFIICDDGSQDAFFQWLSKYCKKDSRILLLHNRTNRGLAAALNRCLSHASGTYIARMDADDCSNRRRLERQAVFLQQHPAYALVGCQAWMFDKHGVWGMRRMEEVPQKQSFLFTSPFIHPAVMIRREIMEKLQGYSESAKVERAEDYDFFMRLYAQGYLGYNMQEVLYAYREDTRTYAKRKYSYRIRECRVRYVGFQRLGILNRNYRYVIKPLVAGLVPARLMALAKRRIFRFEKAALHTFQASSKAKGTRRIT